MPGAKERSGSQPVSHRRECQTSGTKMQSCCNKSASRGGRSLMPAAWRRVELSSGRRSALIERFRAGEPLTSHSHYPSGTPYICV